MTKSLIQHMSEKLFVPRAWLAMLADLDKLLKAPEQWICIYGRLGSGKTSLCKELFQFLPIDKNECVILSIFHEKTESDWLCEAIIKQWDLATIEGESPNDSVLRELETFKQEKRTLSLIIDEAHKLMNDSAFSDINHIANLCKLVSVPFNVILVGTKSLKDNIEKCNLTRNNISYLNEIKALEGEDRLEFLKYELESFDLHKEFLNPELLSLIDSKTDGTIKSLKQITKLIQISESESPGDLEAIINEKLALLPNKRDYMAPKIAFSQNEVAKKRETETKRKRKIKRLLTEDG